MNLGISERSFGEPISLLRNGITDSGFRPCPGRRWGHGAEGGRQRRARSPL